MSNFLHIVSFDIPLPADYGGVIDVWYKIKALHRAGVKIILHCWQYGSRKEVSELENYCEKVYYYRRNKYKNPFIGNIPYIVKTRTSKELCTRLLDDKFPILFEGLHTTAPLGEVDFSDRKVIVRNHNIESSYYRHLGDKESGYFRKSFFYHESKLLHAYESVLSKADKVAAISPAENEILSHDYNSVYIPAFHPNEEVGHIAEKKKDYCLYHGNLAVAENDEAALFLVNQVFNSIQTSLIIAGNKASSELKEKCAGQKHITLLEDLEVERFHDLIHHAAVNVLPTFQATGIKLKLLNALYQGGHCLVNSPMVKETGLEPLCVIADDPQIMQEEVQRLMKTPLSADAVKMRSNILTQKFSNDKSAADLMKVMFESP